MAVAQSDHIVYVYKLGSTWSTDKKIICNKFPQSASITAMCWLTVGPIIAGFEDGKVRALNCKTNKSQNLYGSDNMVVSLASNSRGTGFISGHDDGSVVRFYIADEPGQPSGRLFQHTTAPVALAWPQGEIVAAGCDKKIIFYDSQVCVARYGIKYLPIFERVNLHHHSPASFYHNIVYLCNIHIYMLYQTGSTVTFI